MKILKESLINNIMTYHVSKCLTSEIWIFHHDVDIFSEDGKILLKFRKNCLNKENQKQFYLSTQKQARAITSSQGARMDKMSNIFGWYDSWSQSQKGAFKRRGLPIILPPIRPTKFALSKECRPMLDEIDAMYKLLAPEQYETQKRKQTKFNLWDTVFSTVITNINAQLLQHIDEGDISDGLGNLVVFEKGNYAGGATCFTDYRLGVDCRSGDFLAMDVHQMHYNNNIALMEPEAERFSVVCYAREKIWKMAKEFTEEDYCNHFEKLKIYENIVGRKRKFK